MAAADVESRASAFESNVHWSSRTSKPNALAPLLSDAFGTDFMGTTYHHVGETEYTKPGVFEGKEPINADKQNSPGDEGQAGGTDAGDGEEMDGVETEADRQAQEKVHREGRENALQVPMREIRELTQETAIVAEKMGHYLRDVWHVCNAKERLATIESANKLISQGSGPDFKLPGRELIQDISMVRRTAWYWKNAMLKPAPERSEIQEAGKTVCLAMLSLLKTLASSGIPWKTILTNSTHKVLVTVVESSALDTEIEERLVAYINEDYTLPSNSQALAAVPAKTPLSEFFGHLAKNRDAQAMTSLTELKKINEAITKTNCEIGYRKDDHHLPIQFMEEMLAKLPDEAKKRNEFIAAQKAIHKALFSLLGFTTLADLIVVPKAFARTKLSAEHQDYVSRLCLDMEEFAKQSDGHANSQGSTGSGDHPNPSSADTSQSTAGDSSEEQASNGAAPGPSTGGLGGPQAAPPGASPQAAAGSSNAQGPHAAQSTANDSTFQHGFRGGERPGPCFDDGVTFLGKVVAAQKVGWGYRVIVNCALESFPVYKCYPGKQFGRGTAAEMAENYPMTAKQNLKRRKATHISKFLGIVEVEGNGKVRQPITMFRVRWRPSNEAHFQGADPEEWLTRSDVIAICGDKFTERMRQSLLDDLAYNLEFLRDCKEKGLHPETGKPLEESERELTPWLFPNDTAHRQQGKKSSAKEEDDNDTSHIPTTGQRFGATNNTA